MTLQTATRQMTMMTPLQRIGDSIATKIFVQVEECDDTDSNKTEVEEIEMVDMEGRAEVKPFPKSKQTASFFSEIHDFPMPSI